MKLERQLCWGLQTSRPLISCKAACSCSEHKILMAGEWVLMSLQLRDPGSRGMARALYKLPRNTIKGGILISKMTHVSVCLCVFKSPGPCLPHELL